MSNDPNENNQEKSPKRKILDRLFMGAVIGGAIGSVIGASIAPKKGKETRQDIVDVVKDTASGSKKFFRKLRAMFSFKKKNKQEQSATTSRHSSIKKIPSEDAAEIEQ